MRNDRDPLMILKSNTKGRRRYGKPRERWMPAVISAETSQIRRRRQRILAEQNFSGINNSYSSLEKKILNKNE